MSAPGPRAGSSGRYGKVSSDPVTVLAASRASPPGIDPIPVAAPAVHFCVLFSLTQAGYAPVGGAGCGRCAGQGAAVGVRA
ncbi:hypothetical protein Sliba_23670 [Streptomyces nigrescens]|uniref:Uncharacterized protein n=1 Tax=Streptomyces nigrescens TaxID=1920 RepID=A0A640TFG6_STRNI|nr:hypothetical protein Sliba_23670 [Streptomyces libani subsp. libani]GGV89530.1 hypothetical protein GCM10010500_14500 [Streptomyces libani subsp. libani]